MKQPLTAALTKKPSCRGTGARRTGKGYQRRQDDHVDPHSPRHKLFALKTLAHHRGPRVNTLIDEAIDQYFELHSQPKEAA
jgi:hypothetical protein